jgi:hypothetical protein
MKFKRCFFLGERTRSDVFRPWQHFVPSFPMAPPRALAALVALVAATLVADAAAADALSEARTLGRAEFVSCPA